MFFFKGTSDVIPTDFPATGSPLENYSHQKVGLAAMKHTVNTTTDTDSKHQTHNIHNIHNILPSLGTQNELTLLFQYFIYVRFY